MKMVIDEEEAIDLCKGDYGKETLRQIASYAAPFFWEYRDAGGELRQRNGSMFFVDAGKGIFAVTAKHVFDGYLECLKASNITDFGIVPDVFGRPGREIIPIPLQERLIDEDKETDVATFSITENERVDIGSHVITTWPPATPQLNFGIGLTGYPGHERIKQGPKEISFAPYPILGIPSSISDRQITIQFTDEHTVDTPGFISAPSNYATGGMSGGPLLTHVTRGGISYWRLGGVITAGFHEWGLLKASRVDRLNADGTFIR